MSELGKLPLNSPTTGAQLWDSLASQAMLSQVTHTTLLYTFHISHPSAVKPTDIR